MKLSATSVWWTGRLMDILQAESKAPIFWPTLAYSLSLKWNSTVNY